MIDFGFLNDIHGIVRWSGTSAEKKGSDDEETGEHTYNPANQSYPWSSQYPPGFSFVTVSFVSHFALL